MEDHISRVLKMVEEGRISAEDAEKLISAISKEKATAPASPSVPQPPPPPRVGSTDEEKKEEGSGAKSFEFSWSKKSALPFDLSGLGKQISDTLKKLDPDKLVKEARVGVQRGGKRWQERFRNFSRFLDGQDGRPENSMGYPTSRATEDLIFQVTADASLRIENNYGSLNIVGGADAVSIEIEKEAWAPTDEEAQTALKEIKVEALTHQMPTGATRMDVRVTAPEEWREGFVNLRLRVPDTISLKWETIYGEVRIENVSGSVEGRTVSGTVSLEDIRGELQVDGISGSMHAAKIEGRVRLASKSGDIQAEDLAQGGEVSSVSGEVSVKGAEGAKLEAKSVSGDVTVKNVGAKAPVEMVVESVSGDVKIEDAAGTLQLKTISGDIVAEARESTLFQAQTVSGDVGVKLASPFSGTLSANTVSGDVNVQAPETSSCRFTISTQSGDLSCNLEAKDVNKTDTLQSGSVGAGTGTVTVQTRSGDVSLARASASRRGASQEKARLSDRSGGLSHLITTPGPMPRGRTRGRQDPGLRSWFSYLQQPLSTPRRFEDRRSRWARHSGSRPHRGPCPLPCARRAGCWWRSSAPGSA
jgi:DUF4097 and DUF4098 domain-containing protein YvlB